MAALDFPSSPSVGQIYTPAGGAPTYIWSGTAWSQIGQAGVFKISSGVLASAVATFDIATPGAGFHTLEVLLAQMYPLTDNSQPGFRWTVDGTNFLTTNYAAAYNTVAANVTNTPGGYASGGGGTLAVAQGNNASTPGFFRIQLPQHAGGVQNAIYDGAFWSSVNYCRSSGMVTNTGTSGMAQAIRLYYGNGSNFAAGLKWQVMGYK